jgi:hypothetical protein
VAEQGGPSIRQGWLRSGTAQQWAAACTGCAPKSVGLPVRGKRIQALDYPAGSAWTRRVSGELAIAGIPEAASVFLLIGYGVIWVITSRQVQNQADEAVENIACRRFFQRTRRRGCRRSCKEPLEQRLLRRITSLRQLRSEPSHRRRCGVLQRFPEAWCAGRWVNAGTVVAGGRPRPGAARVARRAEARAPSQVLHARGASLAAARWCGDHPRGSVSTAAA